MRPKSTLGHGAGTTFPQCLLAVLLLSLAAVGCDNTCVRFASNAGTGTLAIQTSNSKAVCSLINTNGIVVVHLNSAGASSAASVAPNPLHIFISLRGVEARARGSADDAPAPWRQLAPKLAHQPAQLDLLARQPSDCSSVPFGEASIPTGVYRQIRLLLVPNQPAAGEPVPPGNACGAAGFNCVVAANGNVTPLALDRAASELSPDSQAIDGGDFFVLPGARVELAIEFSAASSMLFPAGNAARLVPAWTVRLRRTCEPVRQQF